MGNEQKDLQDSQKTSKSKNKDFVHRVNVNHQQLFPKFIKWLESIPIKKLQESRLLDFQLQISDIQLSHLNLKKPLRIQVSFMDKCLIQENINTSKNVVQIEKSAFENVRANLIDLTRKSVEFRFFEDQKEISCYSVNLLAIAIGPQHHSVQLSKIIPYSQHGGKDKIIDLALLNTNIQFNQYQMCCLRPLKLRLQFLEHMMQDHLFCFKIDVITFEEVCESKPSELKELQQSQDSNFKDQVQWQAPDSKVEFNLNMQHLKDASLKFEIFSAKIKTKELHVPIIPTNSTVFQKLHKHNYNQINTNLHKQTQVKVYRPFQGDDEPLDMEDDQTPEINVLELEKIGTSHVNLEKIQTRTIKMTVQDDQDERLDIGLSGKIYKSLKQDLYHLGHMIGVVEVELMIDNAPFIAQSKVGVMQNNGVWFQTQALSSQNSASDKIRTFLDLKNKIIKHDRGTNVLNFMDLMEIFQKTINLLEQSEKRSNTCFNYSSSEEMRGMQLSMIEFGNHLIEMKDWVQEHCRPLYHKMLTLVINRGEFDVGNLSTQNQVKAESVKVANEYKTFLAKTLQAAIFLLSVKTLEQDQKLFLESAVSICFFRIPQFRNCFLNLIEQKDQYKTVKKRGIFHFFDWQTQVYAAIPAKDAEISEKIIDKALNDPMTDQKWQSRIKKRGVAYFNIMKNWVEYVSRTLVSTSLQWDEIPGYDSIIATLLNEMQDLEVVKYPDAMKETLLSFLSNRHIIVDFLNTVFKKTNAYDTQSVMATLELVASWFHRIKQRGKLLPPEFDFEFFFKGVQMLLDLDHGTQTAKAIWLLYQVMHTLPSKEREFLIKNLLMPENFYKFMFHWSWNVRQSFQYFYFFQLHPAIIQSSTSTQDVLNHVEDNLKTINIKSSQNLAVKASDSQKFAIKDGLGTSRLQGKLNSELQDLFQKRVSEIETLKRLSKTVMDQMNRNKDKIFEEQRSLEIQIKELKKNITKQNIQQIKELQLKICDFNVTHYAAKDKYLTKNQRGRWNEILSSIAQHNQIYIYQSLEHLREVDVIYNEWTKKTQTGKNLQGMDSLPDLPVVKIEILEDHSRFEQTQHQY